MLFERTRKDVDDLVALAWLIGEATDFMESRFQRRAGGRDSPQLERITTMVARHRLLVAVAVAACGVVVARARASGRS
jgi:hypothetical protein